MRILIPVFQGRVSPLLDAARHFLLVDVGLGGELERRQVDIQTTELVARARRIRQLGAQVLICGAISRPLEATLASAGIRVIPNTCGPVEEVLQVFISGNLTERVFLMPGCSGRRRRHRGRHGRGGHG